MIGLMVRTADPKAAAMRGVCSGRLRFRLSAMMPGQSKTTRERYLMARMASPARSWQGVRVMVSQPR